MWHGYILKFCGKIFRFNSNGFTFFSGIFISATINIITTLIFTESININILLLLSISFMFISSALWLVLASKLQPLQEVYNIARHSYDKPQKAWDDTISPKLNNLVIIFVLAIILSILSVVFLGFKNCPKMLKYEFNDSIISYNRFTTFDSGFPWCDYNVVHTTKSLSDLKVKNDCPNSKNNR